MGVYSSRSILLLLTLSFFSASCERYEPANAPSSLAFGRIELTAASEARLLGRNAACPASQPFLWTHPIEVREVGGVGVTVLDWQTVEMSGTTTISGVQQRNIQTLNQCSPLPGGRLAPNSVACGTVTYCGASVVAGRVLEHRIFVGDDNAVPNAAVVRVPLATQ